jgi:hypothetical protein
MSIPCPRYPIVISEGYVVVVVVVVVVPNRG